MTTHQDKAREIAESVKAMDWGPSVSVAEVIRRGMQQWYPEGVPPHAVDFIFRFMVREISDALLSAEQRGIERAANLIESGFDREHAEIWAKDGVTRTKFDRCPHGRQVNDDCEQCCAAAIRSLASKDNGKDG